MKWFVILALCWSQTGWGADRLHLVMKSSSVRQMESSLARFEEDEMRVKLCEVELQQEKVPVHCLQLLSAPGSFSGELNEWRPYLSRLCQKAVTSLVAVGEIRTLLSSLRADRDCFEAAKKRKQRLEYMHPEAIIRVNSNSRL